MAQQPRRLATILSFSHDAYDADHPAPPQEPEDELEGCDDDGGDGASDDSGDSFEFAFARPLVDAAGCSGGDGDGDFAVADDLFAHGRILPAYPVFDRRNLLDDSASAASASSSFTAPPSPDTYCAWAPRSAPGSPARDFFPKSASTGTGTREALPHRFRLRDLLAGANRRSHSDGKEKFVFLQPTTPQRTTALSSAAAAAGDKRSKKKPAPPPPQAGGKKKGGAVSTEMDMATAHRLFYSKTGGERRQQQQHATSYLPYRPGIVGFFAAAHALGRSPHRPY